MDWPREEFGDEHALAVSAAYEKVRRLVTAELETVCRGDDR
jgi:hypothetical protein